MKVTILGSGTSIGVPVPTCTCEVCQSTDPHDNRLRCSALVTADDGCNILIDCGPDYRYQSLRARIMRLDALLLTHNHFDHCYGLDDLRAWTAHEALPTYADTLMSEALTTRWDYIFVHRYPGTPQLDLHTLCPDQNPEAAYHRLSYYEPKPLDGTGGAPATFLVGETLCQAIRCFHGALPMLGYRIGRLAYITDCTLIPEAEFSKLQGIDTLIIDALRWHPHATHYSVEQALDVAQRIAPRQILFTHISHDMGLHADFQRLLREKLAHRFPSDLLDRVQLAYDTQEIEIK